MPDSLTSTSSFSKLKNFITNSDNLRGFATKNNNIKNYVFFRETSPNGHRWGRTKNDNGDIVNEGWDHPVVGYSSIVGASLLSFILCAPADFLENMSSSSGSILTPAAMTTEYEVVGALFLVPAAIATLYSATTSFLSIISSCRENKKEFGNSSTFLGLLHKLMTVITGPLMSALCFVAQATYCAFSLLCASLSFVFYLVPGFNKMTGLKGVKAHLRDATTCYLDMVAHTMSVGLSLIINSGDFLTSLVKTICCCKSDSAEEESESGYTPERCTL